MFKKWFKILIITFLLIMGLMYLWTYIWFHNSIDRALTEEQQSWLIEEIDNTPDLPDNIYETMKKYFPNFFSSNSWNYKIKSLLGNRSSHCQCSEIYLPYIPPGRSENFKVKWVPMNQHDLIIKLFIEKNFDQRKCFTFNMNISEFGMDTDGISEAAVIYFDKELKDLTEKEIIGLYFIQKAPTYYNPIYNRENFNNAVNNVINNENLTQK